jgi:P4 family phage/plasmid primase-like protien
MNLMKYFEHVGKNETRETHVWMGPYPGKKFLSQNYRDQFYDAYNQALFQCNEKLYIAEKPRKTGENTPVYVPLVVDIDLSCDLPFEGALYSIEDVKQVIKCFHRVLDSCLLHPKSTLFICCVLEKPAKASDKRWKNGFHLHFPFAQFAATSIKETIFPAVKIEMDSFCYDNGRRLFGLDKPSVSLDSNTPNLPWLMYGSRKNESSDPYLLSLIFNQDLHEMSLENLVQMEVFENANGDILNFKGFEHLALVRLFSIDAVVSHKSLKRKPKLKRSAVAGPAVAYGPFSSLDASVETNLLRVKQLVELLSPIRASNYETWWNVMITIFNVTGGSEEGFQAWNTFSKKSEKYDKEATGQIWKDAAGRPRHPSLRTRHFGSLVHWAREDDPDALDQIYAQWKTVTNNLLVYNTDWKIASHFFEKHKAKYVFHNKTWYEYDGVIWEILKDPLTRMRKDIVDLGNEWNVKDLNDLDQKRYHNLIKRLEGSDQSAILSQATTIFEVKDFGKLLDSDPSIIAFKNGIFDMEKMCFRQSSPYSDYLSMCLPVSYREYCYDDPEVKNLENFFEKLFPCEDLRKYFLSQIAEIFWGANRDKIAMFWIGTGNNGKTVMQLLLEHMLGPFSKKSRSTVLTSKRPQQGGATPEIASLKGARWVMMEELNAQEEIEVGNLKQLTGNDTLAARHLYGDEFEFVPTFKIAVACNSFPKLRNPDEATWNRVRVIPFESCFVEECKAPSTFEEQKQSKRFPKNVNIRAEFPKMATVLAWFLLEIFKENEIKRKSNSAWEMDIPDIVRSEKERYKRNCNKIQQFAEEKLEPCSKEEKERDTDTLYVMFRDWWCDNVDKKPPPKCDFDSEMMRIGNVDELFYKLKPSML